MKKVLKKMILICVLAFVSTTIFAKSISIRGITEILKVVTKIYTQQQLMGSEQLRQGMSLVTQIENQVKQIENQYTMLNQLGKEISDGNLIHIDSYYNELGNMLDSYKSAMFDMEKLSSEYMKLFEENPQQFEEMGFSREYMESMDENIRRARQQSDNALYDVMTQKGFVAKLGADEQNLKTLLEASKNSKGVVEALQVTNNILGQISTNISQLGVLTETANKAQAMAENTESKELKNSKKEVEKAKKSQGENDEAKAAKLKGEAGKSIQL